MSYKVLDLFAGAGGFSEGFSQAGFDIVGAIDINEEFLETHEHNHPESKHVCTDLMSAEPGQVLEENVLDKNEIDIVVGGPPCKGFSIAGKRKEDDKRNNLVDRFIDWVEYIETDMFLMENVTGILTMKNGEVVEVVMDRYEELGYEAEYKTLNAANFGVPQKRRRVIFIGRRDGEKPIYPEPTHRVGNQERLDKSGLKPPRTVRDAILDNDFSGCSNHIKTDHSDDMRDRLSELDFGETLYESYGDSWKRLHPDKPSITIKENHNAPLVHPVENRVGTVRECATLQSFPMDYEFKGSKSKQLKQVGNAVPPKLAKKLAEVIGPQLEEIKRKGSEEDGNIEFSEKEDVESAQTGLE